MKYRTSADIIAIMLQATYPNGVTKTKIMYKAALSYEQLKHYIQLLLEDQLLRHDNVAQRYYVTEKGKKFVQLYDAITDLAPSSYQKAGYEIQ